MTSASQQASVIEIGLETYALEMTLGALPVQATAAAIMAAARAHETAVLRRISRAAELVATSLLAEPSGRYHSHAAAITWFTDTHVLALPALADTSQYQPAPGDILEVTLTGAVLSADSAGTWTMADMTTGRRYRFRRPGRDGAPRLHVLDAARPQLAAGSDGSSAGDGQ